MAKLDETLAADDFHTVKTAIEAEMKRIEAEIKALDSERSTMEDLLEKVQTQAVDLAGAWQRGNVNQKHELATAFFPDGLAFSHERLFFEPSNTVINQMVWRFLDDLGNVGVPTEFEPVLPP